MFQGYHVIDPDHNAIITVTTDNYHEIIDKYVSMVKMLAVKRGTVDTILEIMSSPYRLKFLSLIHPLISKRNFAYLLSWIWTQTEFTHANGETLLIDLFTKAGKDVMDADEKRVFKALPDELTVYRGTQSDKAVVKGMSWSVSKNTAVFFASRFPILNGSVYTATICKPAVLAYFSRRDEQEVVVDPKRLTKLKREDALVTHPPKGPKPESPGKGLSYNNIDPNKIQ